MQIYGRPDGKLCVFYSKSIQRGHIYDHTKSSCIVLKGHLMSREYIYVYIYSLDPQIWGFCTIYYTWDTELQNRIFQQSPMRYARNPGTWF
jgi:hypothetical protein